jgi:AcrR family transcriptional regulator
VPAAVTLAAVARGGKPEEGKEKLRRLPPGRHGLSREFVSRNQRERLVAGTISAVAEHGYLDTSVGRIAAAAGVSRQTFYDYFAAKEDCFLASYELLETHLLGALEEAAAPERGWVAKVRSRLHLLLEMLSENPDLVRFSLIAPLAAGGEIRTRERRFVDRLLAELTADPPKSSPLSPGTIELEAVAGGLISILTTRVRAGATDLTALQPDLLELVLAPYLGRTRAAKEAGRG